MSSSHKTITTLIWLFCTFLTEIRSITIVRNKRIYSDVPFFPPNVNALLSSRLFAFHLCSHFEFIFHKISNSNTVRRGALYGFNH